ncbi:hypothetical protein ACOTVD_09455, partial [Campylobacter jejuni]|uniref:hypothetical protein n=1 Tax=Campylobacter jejuni TaxID=197 RepID=UPI003B9DA36A
TPLALKAVAERARGWGCPIMRLASKHSSKPLFIGLCYPYLFQLQIGILTFKSARLIAVLIDLFLFFIKIVK